MILSMFNQMPLATVTVDISVAGNTRPVLVVQGLDADIGLNWEKRKILKEKGLRIFDSVEIEYEGCKKGDDTPVDKVRLLDQAVIRVNPAFKKGDSFNFPQGIKGLKEKGLSVSFNNEELVIRGIAHFSEYEDVLRQMVYVSLVPKDILHLEIYVSLVRPWVSFWARRRANWPAVGTIFSAWFDHLEESCLIKKFGSKRFAHLYKSVDLLLGKCQWTFCIDSTKRWCWEMWQFVFSLPHVCLKYWV